jgi:hypothetical protein
MSLAACGLTGTLPQGLPPFLTYLSLGNNKLVGSIPNSVGSLSSLITLDLSSNLLVGTIPANLGLLQSLAILKLQNNFLTGTVPSGVIVLGATAAGGPSVSGNCLTPNGLLDVTAPSQTHCLSGTSQRTLSLLCLFTHTLSSFSF